jgi:hypothetical protein
LLTYAQVIGTDLSPIQPELVPPNLKFIMDDANLDWVFGEMFDYIHVRDLLDTGGIKDVLHFVENAFKFVAKIPLPPNASDARFRSLKCGGWVEFQAINLLDFEYTEKTESSSVDDYRDWANTIKDLMPERDQWERLQAVLSDLGFKNIREECYPIPMGQSAGGIGQLAFHTQMDGLDAWSLKPLTAKGWNRMEIDVLVQRAVKALIDERFGREGQW